MIYVNISTGFGHLKIISMLVSTMFAETISVHTLSHHLHFTCLRLDIRGNGAEAGERVCNGSMPESDVDTVVSSCMIVFESYDAHIRCNFHIEAVCKKDIVHNALCSSSNCDPVDGRRVGPVLWQLLDHDPFFVSLNFFVRAIIRMRSSSCS